MSVNGPGFSSGNPIESLVVMLHGRGSSGDNMIAIAPQMSKGLPNTQFIAPHACMKYGIGYTWFSDSLRDMKEGTALDEITGSVELVNKFIDAQLEKLGIGDDKLALVGFSQGAMLSVYLGLIRKKRCAAVVAYSGAIPFPNALEPRICSKPNVCVVHGTHDYVIPFSYLEESVNFLNKNSVPVEWHKIQGLDHSISNECLDIGIEFIKRSIDSSKS